MNCSDTLNTAIHLFYQQFQQLVMEGEADFSNLIRVLRPLVHLDPFQAMGSGELGFSWIAEVLNSGYEEEYRREMASEVVGSLGKYLFREDPVPFIHLQPTWIPR